MRVILVPVADRPECAEALGLAFGLGQRLGTHVRGCHIRPHRHSEVSLPTKFGSPANEDAAWELAMKRKLTEKSSAAARSLFANVAERHDLQLNKRPRTKPGAVWLEKVGSPNKVLSIMGPVSDLLVVSRPQGKRGKVARLFMIAALLNSTRPVLVLLQRGAPTIGQRICIAWNQSAEAARTVAAALPLIQGADEVHILTSDPETGLGPKSSQLATYLRFSGVNSHRIVSRGKDEVAELIEGFKKTESDLPIMGAYSRSRLRQQIFGGVTDYMLKRANIPVLMLHT